MIKNQLMDMKKLSQLALAFICLRTLGSCTTFHTPTSRELVSTEYQEALVVEEADDDCHVSSKKDLEKCLKESPQLNQPVARQPSTVQHYLSNHFDWPVDEAQADSRLLSPTKEDHI